MTGSISASGDACYLINKNSTTTVWNYWLCFLFFECTSLTTAPKLPATSLWDYGYFCMFAWCTNLKTAPSLPATTTQPYCYYQMFHHCENLEQLPQLPSTTLANFCYQQMFQYCSKIKLSTSQTGEYQTAYRIPNTWTWTSWTDSTSFMFWNTWWTFTANPIINTTYYTSNTVV